MKRCHWTAGCKVHGATVLSRYYSALCCSSRSQLMNTMPHIITNMSLAANMALLPTFSSKGLCLKYGTTSFQNEIISLLAYAPKSPPTIGCNGYDDN